MVAAWSYTGGPPSPGGSGQVTLVQGRTFCVSDPTGDLGAAPTHGLFVADTRFVNRLVLRVDGDPLEPLGVQPIGPHATTFVTRRRPRTGLADSTLLVLRSRLEVVEHTVTGMVVRHPRDLADGIRRVSVIDPPACRRQVASRFSIEAMTAGYERAYRRATRGVTTRNVPVAQSSRNQPRTSASWSR